MHSIDRRFGWFGFACCFYFLRLLHAEVAFIFAARSLSEGCWRCVGCLQQHFISSISASDIYHITFCNQSFSSVFILFFLNIDVAPPPSPSHALFPLSSSVYFLCSFSRIIPSIALFSLLVHWSRHFYFRFVFCWHFSLPSPLLFRVLSINYDDYYDDNRIYESLQ